MAYMTREEEGQDVFTRRNFIHHILVLTRNRIYLRVGKIFFGSIKTRIRQFKMTF